MIINAWNVARLELGIQIVAPMQLYISDNLKVECEVWLPDFGGKKGAILLPLAADDDRAEFAKKDGYFVSLLGEAYRNYDKELFVDTLDDFEWTNNEKAPPKWYTGKPWA